MKGIEQFKQHTYTPNSFYDYVEQMERGMGGDIELKITPAEEDKAEIEAGDMDGYEQEVKVQVVDGEGKVHSWYQGKLNVQVVNGSSGDGGTVAINDEDPGGNGEDVDEDLQFEDGELTFVIKYGEGDGWTAGEDVEVTVDKDDKDILGYAVKVENHNVLEVQSD